MPPSPLEVLDDEVAQYRQERSALEASLREVNLKIETLEALRSKLAALMPASRIRSQPPAEPSSGQAAVSGKPPIRAMVREILRSLEIFSTIEMVDAVQAIRSDAKESSIRSELSHCKTRGEVVAYGNDRYRSCLFEGTPEEDDLASLVTSVFAGEDDEPRPGFGRILP